jgi:fumarate reductase subunit D
MARSNKPIVWGPFAAGGTLSAFLTPVLMLLTLLAALGHAPDVLAYENLRAFAGHWLAKAAIVVVVFFSLWSAAHRLRITAYDLGVRADTLVAWVVYLVAGSFTIAAAIFLARIG